jgi:eukaryotic-like serine/threonine-protein kinase
VTDKHDIAALRTLNRLVDEALALEPSARTTWLDQLTTEYDAFKPRLRAMLDAVASEDFDEFLATMPAIDVEAADDAAEAPPAFAAGAMVGAYRLVRQLARGGQGVVWLAERADGLLERAVAIKLPVGLAHRRGLAERLAREREILGRLEHPNIARLYDAGVAASGEPYLAMEFVDGRPIDAFVAEGGFDTRAVVRLVLQVASAVAYAHGALVIHRDLKPSNVLVDREGRARLLDFGIAALMDEGGDERDGLTEDGGRALTLAYASPEQVERRPLGVATDIYSLGVLTFELLAGRRPYDLPRDTAGALEDAILHAEPAVASRVAASAERRRALAGDLDTILRKALRKQAADRYDTVAAFADDLRRWLDGRPVLAQPDRWIYRTRKFLRRNRVPVAAAAAVTLAVGTGAGVAYRQTQQARAADAQAASAEVFISSMLRHANIDAPESQSDLLVVDLLRRARQDVIAMDAPPATRVRLMNLIADGLRGFGQSAEYGDIAARALAEAAVLGPDHPETLKAGYQRATALMQQGKAAEAMTLLTDLLPRLERQAATDPTTFARALRLVADVGMADAKYRDAEAAARKAVEATERHLGPAHPETATALRTLGEVLGLDRDTDPAQALAVAAQALERTLEAHKYQPKHPWILRARELYAGALGDAGQLESAVAELERALALKIAIQGERARGVAFSRHTVSGNQYRLGRFADAIANNTRVLDILSPQLDHETIDYLNIANLRGLLMASVRRGDETIAAIAPGQPAHAKLMGASHALVLMNRAIVAAAHGYEGRLDRAAREMASVLADMRAAGAAMPPVLLTASRLYRLLGRDAEAARLLADAETAAGTGAPAERLVAQIRMERALLVTPADAATTAITQALAKLDALYPVATPWQADGHVALARLLQDEGRAIEAGTHARVAVGVWRSLNPDGPWLAEAERLLAPASTTTTR